MAFSEKGSQGAAHFNAPNPPFGAVFTYYLKEDIKTKKELRLEKEKKLNEKNKNVPFPGWESVESERRQEDPAILLVVKDNQGNVVRRVPGKAQKGFHRVAWDLRYPSFEAIELKENPNNTEPTGVLAAPGEYTVTLIKQLDGIVTELSGPVSFEVVPLRKGALEGAPIETVTAFWQDLANLYRSISAARVTIAKNLTKVDYIKKALERSKIFPGQFDKELYDLRQALLQFDEDVNGNRSKRKIGEDRNPTLLNRVNFAMSGTANSTYGPTPLHQRSFDIASKQFKELKTKLDDIIFNQMPDLEKRILKAGAPLIEGQPIPE